MASPGTEQVEKNYQAAKARWPSVGWPSEAFARHVNGEDAKYPQDLFLAGAAAHRVPQAWEVIETDLAPPVKRVLARHPMADFSVDDLWAETIARLLDSEPEFPTLPDGRLPARMIRYRGQVPLLNYLVVVARNLAIGRHRQHRVVVSYDAGGDDADRTLSLPDTHAPEPDANLAETEAVREMREQLRESFQKLSAEQQFLITMVYRQGMKKKDAGALLGWSPFKTTRSLGAAMDRLRKSLTDLKSVNWTPRMAAAWEECLGECWNEMDEVQAARLRSSDTVSVKTDEGEEPR